MKRGAEVKMPVTTRQDDRHSLMEERRKVNFNVDTSKLYMVMVM